MKSKNSGRVDAAVVGSVQESMTPQVEASVDYQDVIRSSGERPRVAAARQMALDIEKRSSEEGLQRFKFLFEEYEPRCWWCEARADVKISKRRVRWHRAKKEAIAYAPPRR